MEPLRLNTINIKSIGIFTKGCGSFSRTQKINNLTIYTDYLSLGSIWGDLFKQKSSDRGEKCYCPFFGEGSRVILDISMQ